MCATSWTRRPSSASPMRIAEEYSSPPPSSETSGTARVGYGNGPNRPSMARTASAVASSSSSAEVSASGSTPAVILVPSTSTVAVSNSPTATATSRATGSCDSQTRRPPGSSRGGAWSPDARTTRSPGAETRSVVSAAGAAVVSPLISTIGSSAQPCPGSQVSSGTPLPHHVTSSATPRRSKPAGVRWSVSRSRRSSSTATVRPAGTGSRRSTRERPPGVPGAAPASTYPPSATRSPRTASTVSRCPADCGAFGTSRNHNSSTGRSGVKVTVSVPVTVRRSSARRRSRSTTGRSGSVAARSVTGQPAAGSGAAAGPSAEVQPASRTGAPPPGAAGPAVARTGHPRPGRSARPAPDASRPRHPARRDPRDAGSFRNRPRRAASADGGGAAGLQPRLQLLGRQWPAEVVPLDDVAAQGGQRVDGGLVLGALGDEDQAQGVGELQRRGDDRRRPVAAGHRADEGAVQLELGHREGGEVGEAGPTGAVVVDGDADAGLAQSGEHTDGALPVLHEQALGHLEHQCGRGDGVPYQHPGHLVGEALVDQVGGADVDGDGQLAPAVGPRPPLRQGGVQHPPGQRRHEPGGLGQLDEGIGEQQSPLGVLPAHQRLHAVDPAGRQAQLRLVVQHQLALVDGPPQLGDGLEAVPARAVALPPR